MAPGSRQGGRGVEMVPRGREQGLQNGPSGRGAGKEVQEV